MYHRRLQALRRTVQERRAHEELRRVRAEAEHQRSLALARAHLR
jgi:hypothetical protein